MDEQPNLEDVPVSELKLELAKRALWHILRRAQEAPEFAWHFIHTEGERKVLGALAAIHNLTEEELETNYRSKIKDCSQCELVKLRSLRDALLAANECDDAALERLKRQAEEI